MYAKLKAAPLWLQIAAAIFSLAIVCGSYSVLRSDPCAPDNRGPYDGETLYACTVKAVSEVHKDLVAHEDRQAFLNEWQDKYEGSLQLKTEKGTLKAITEMLLSLKGRFDYFLTPQQAAQSAIISKGSIAGIGASLAMPKAQPTETATGDLPKHLSPQLGALLEDKLPKEPLLNDSNPLVVAADPERGTPAANAGVKAGDIIVAVDGLAVSGKTMSAVVDEVRGSAGSRVRLTIERNGQRKNLQLVRAVVELPTTESKTIGDTAYLRIYHFESGLSVAQVHDEFDILCGAGADQAKCDAKALIVDLRDNPGGLMNAVILISELFVDQGDITTVLERDGDRMANSNVSFAGSDVIVNGDGVTRKNKRDLDVHFPLRAPVVVLVNKRSGSGAEMLASILQQQRGAVVVGEQTVGKGVGQCTVDLPYGYSSRIICLEYLAGGKSVDWVGVTPDVVVEQPDGVRLGTAEDVQLARALEIARGAPVVKSTTDTAAVLKQRKDEYTRDVEEIINRFLR